MTARSDIRVDAVFDIETEEWDRFVMAGIYYADGTYRHFDWTNIAHFFDAIFNIHGDVWAHFGGGFDIKLILDEALRRGYNVKVASAGSLIRSARIGKLTLRDSFALYPATLAKFTAGLGVEKKKLVLECYCGNDCGGYCRIRRDMSDSTFERVAAYLQADCQSLLYALDRLRSWAQKNDIDLAPTVGLASWRFMHRRFGIPKATLKGADFTFAREAYYGGRCEVFRHGAWANVHEADVRSMYPWALWSAKLPTGTPRDIRAPSLSTLSEPGIHRATVFVPPDMDIPPLPIRTPKRIYYPTGVFEGVWTTPELEYARSLGCNVISARRSLVFPDTANLFREWAETIFHVRHDLCGGADSSLGMFAKFLANAPTGKLGQNPERWQIEINPRDVRTGGENAHEEISPGIWRSRSYRIADCAHPEWAAYLTAISRVKLHKALVSVPDACYCDTDSVHSLTPVECINPAGLGDFESKGVENSFYAGPKLYERGGKVKAKGQAKLSKLENGAQTSRVGIRGFGSGARKGEFFRKTVLTRTVNFGTGGRVALPNGLTRPMTIEEALIHSKKR